MRFRLLLLLLPVLLGACSKTAAPVRLDFIGNTTLTSGSKVVAPTDTLTTRAYALSNDNLLERLRITVTYDRGLSPIVYPVPLTGYDPKTGPDPQTILYLDSLITPVIGTNAGDPRGGEYLFENRFSARATSGSELWQYTATDASGESASRAYRLTVRKPDSAAVYHSYSLSLRPQPRSAAALDPLRDRAHVFLNLHYGLLLPKYAVLNNEGTVQENQQLVDLICAVRGTNIALEAPAYAGQLPFLSAAKWPVRRVTRLRRTGLSSDDFAKALTDNAFNAVFNSGQLFASNSPDSLSTGTLAKNQVVAFRTVEGKTGLLLVSDVVLGTAPLVRCTVKVQK